jgi:hypothetical protein
MALPKIDYPIFEIEGILGKSKPIKFRPFSVKEQKILMMASESSDIKEVVRGMQQIIQNCCLESIDAEKLSLSDIEIIFLHLRAKSVSENVDIYFKCNNIIEDGSKCGMVIDISLDLLKDVKVESKQPSNTIWLNDKIAVKMKNPTLDVVRLIEMDDASISDKIIALCLDKVIEEEEVHDMETVTEEELVEFVGQIQTKDYEKMWEFIQNTPKIKYEEVHKCPRCSYEHRVKLEGLSDFFS